MTNPNSCQFSMEIAEKIVYVYFYCKVTNWSEIYPKKQKYLLSLVLHTKYAKPKMTNCWYFFNLIMLLSFFYCQFIIIGFVWIVLHLGKSCAKSFTMFHSSICSVHLYYLPLTFLSFSCSLKNHLNGRSHDSDYHLVLMGLSVFMVLHIIIFSHTQFNSYNCYNLHIQFNSIVQLIQ